MTSLGDRYAALARREAENQLRPLPCFRLDRTLVTCPGWMEADGRIVAADKEFGCYYQAQDNELEVISQPRDRRARLGLMRVVRELAMLRAGAERETLDLHAAALAWGGRAILLAGEKNSGKTTLLAYALTSRHTALMANDRVIVEGRGWRARGVPTLVSVRGETQRLFPALGNGLPRGADVLHQGELAAEAGAPASAEGPLWLSLAQFARQMNSRLEPSAAVGAIVIPEISPSTRSWSLVPLEPSEAAACLRRNIYSRTLAPHTDGIFQKMAKALTGADEHNCVLERLAARVPVMRCLLGPRAYSASADDWLKALEIDEGAAPR